MKQIITIDVGGTSIKYGLWNHKYRNLSSKGKIKTPDNLEDFYQVLEIIVANFSDEQIDGVGLSIPGAVDQRRGMICGISALPYIHNFPIQAAIEERLGLPVTMENDANCAALAEISMGVATHMQNIIFVVVGTGVGGSVVVHRQIVHGSHRLGGEFGMILGHGNKRLSFLGTAVHMAQDYNRANQTNLTGKEVLQLAENGDKKAQKYTKSMFYNLAKVIYNLQFVIDPEAIVIGGGVSENQYFLDTLESTIKNLVENIEDIKLIPHLIPAKYHNDSNLIGAAYNYFYG
ncbi:ROK family protein [Companilactobacillus halodurans]|uniref:ROK family protein n=1 Tax=Companilactobacillus halodurans TaxID=2584183 RepID=A0A5P0ZUY6_9LACO|nr:ROK family protein [Companilactobacillus halodurans]MQS96849.1 ROK family protein [Companilactobacillus halodurans]